MQMSVRSLPQLPSLEQSESRQVCAAARRLSTASALKKYLERLSVCVLVLAAAPLGAAENDEPATLSIGSVSIVPIKWDKDANTQKIENAVRAAAGQGARLIITPEGALEGYVVNEVIRQKDVDKKERLIAQFRELAEPIDGPYIRRFRALADELNIYLVLGFLEAEKSRTFNTAALIGPDGQIVGKYRKTHFHQGYVINPPGYTPGDAYPVFDIGFMKVGIMICFDRQLPEPARALALGGADLIACPSYGGWGDWNTRVMQVRAYENHAYVVFTHPEQSLIIDRNGNLLRQCLRNANAVHNLDLSHLRKTRQSMTRRRPDTYRSLSERTNQEETDP